MHPSPARELTRAASRQTFYTIRFLVDRARREDAYCAYAYFRWVDDTLDAEGPTDFERRSFLERQETLLDVCLRGQAPQAPSALEAMLVELVGRSGSVDGGLETYLRNMMRVLRFDVERRGHLISQVELDDYTGVLARAVTEAMHYFIGNGAVAPMDDTRYRAVTGAHVLHMLRDTCADVRAGYFNVPRERLETFSIGPGDIHSDGYRAWVAERVQLARACFLDGRGYLARVEAPRHRLAVLAYMARFEWLIPTLKRDDYRLRPRYPEARRLTTGLRMSWLTMAWMAGLERGQASQPITIRPG
jgi:phytoene/squalene synthetase